LRAATNRAVYLAAADVFALGLCAYEVARMAEVPNGYVVPTNGSEYSDLREGLAPPFERHLMRAPGCCFGRAYEGAVRDVLAPRSYQDRPTAQQVLAAFEALELHAPLAAHGVHHGVSSPAGHGGGAVLGSSASSAAAAARSSSSAGSAPPPPPPASTTPPSSEVERLRAQVRQLEAQLEVALAAAQQAR
jgi:hypothetical protein